MRLLATRRLHSRCRRRFNDLPRLCSLLYGIICLTHSAHACLNDCIHNKIVVLYLLDHFQRSVRIRPRATPFYAKTSD